CNRQILTSTSNNHARNNRTKWRTAFVSDYNRDGVCQCWRYAMKRLLFACVFSSVMMVNAGCRTTCERHPWCHRNDPPPVVKPVFVPPPPPTPCVQAQPIQQSGGFPVLPPGALVNPPPTGNVFPQAPPAGNAFPQAPPSISKTPEPKVEPQWQP